MKFSDFKKNIDSMGKKTSLSDDLGSNSKNLEAILNIIKTINRSLILDDVLELVLKNSIEMVNADRGFIVLRNSTGDLEYKLGLNNKGSSLPKSHFEISTTVVQDVFNTGQSIFLEAAQSDTNYDQSKSILKLDLQTILCSPLITGDKKIGVVYVDSKSLQKIKARDITDTFEILAGQAAIAIRNAQLYQGQIKSYNSLQQANKQLRIAKEEAEKSDKLKSDFLSQMSHEIRTPINIIFGFTSLLRDIVEDKLVEDHSETFEMINNAGQRIMRTVDTILEMSQIQTGNFEIKNEDLQIEKDILRPILRDFQLKAQSKKLDFIFENVSSNQNIQADRYMLTQVFTHLIDNAIKFTSKGKVEILIFNNQKKAPCVSVKDTGLGISDEYQTKLYAPFSQEDTGYTRRFEGNGLGLAIVKRYVELNKADIEVQSQKGVGTTFTVVFKKEQ